jgi:hypothetical protein
MRYMGWGIIGLAVAAMLMAAVLCGCRFGAGSVRVEASDTEGGALILEGEDLEAEVDEEAAGAAVGAAVDAAL